jgi:superfamily II DNA helicase RecQ
MQDLCRSWNIAVVNEAWLYSHHHELLTSTDHDLQKEAGISSAHYHAGMSAGARVKVQNAWRSGAVQVCSPADPKA